MDRAQIAPRARTAGSAPAARNCTRHVLRVSVGGLSMATAMPGLAACALRMIASGDSGRCPRGGRRFDPRRRIGCRLRHKANDGTHDVGKKDPDAGHRDHREREQRPKAGRAVDVENKSKQRNVLPDRH